MPNQTIIEFQDDSCRLFHWKQTRNSYTLTADVTVPFEKPSAQAPELPPPADDSGNLQVEAPGDEASAGQPAKSVRETNRTALRRALKDAGVKPQAALALVPKHWVTLRVVTLPTTDMSELGEMAQFEAERHIPFNVERHIIAHHVISTDDIQGSRVVLAALDGPPAEQITAAFEAAGVELAGVEVSTLALVNALLRAGRWDHEKAPTVAHVNVGRGNTDIIILHNGEPIFARSTGLGVEKVRESIAEALLRDEPTVHRLDETASGGFPAPEALAPAEPDPGAPGQPPPTPGPLAASPEPESPRGASPLDAAGLRSNRLIREIRRTLDYAHREFECQELSRIFISGVGADVEHLEDAFRASFGVETRILDPFADPTSGGGPKLKRSGAAAGPKEPPAAYALAVGALLRDVDEGALQVNLVPRTYTEARAKSRRKRSLSFLGVVIAAGLVAGFLTTSRLLAERKKDLKAIDTQLEENAGREKEILDRQNVLKILTEDILVKKSALVILDEISKWNQFFVKGKMRVAVSDFQYSATRVIITGYAREFEDLSEFEALLNSTKFFTKVERLKHDPVANSRVRMLHYEFRCDFILDKKR